MFYTNIVYIDDGIFNIDNFIDWVGVISQFDV